jgi:phosphonate transport system substrate-binding protein
MIRFLLVLVSALMALPLQAAPAEAPPASYRLGVFPYMAPRQTVEFYGPVAASMQAALQHPVRLESVPTFAAFGRALAQNSYDIALIQPFDYPVVVEKLGYVPLAQFAVPLVTQFFVRNDSRYRKIEDLRGTTIAMPPAPAANTRMALRALYDNNLIPGADVTVRYFSSHDSCIQQVWAGTASACGTAKPPILVFEKRMQAKLRAIYDTPPIPHIMFVANPRVPAEQRAKLQALIIGWSTTEDGRAMLKNLGFPGFVAPKPTEYAVMHNYDPVGAIATPALAAGKELVMGVFPFLAPRQLAQNFAPMLPALSKSAGTPIHLRTATSFDSFSDAMAAATYDIVVVQPFDYAAASGHGYLPLAGMNEQLQGSFFVRNKSAYKQIADFRGKVVAMPPIDAAQSRLGRHALLQAGLKPGRDVTIVYRKTHDSCLRQVQQGRAAACVTAERSLGMVPEEVSRGLRAVGLTEKIPGVVFMAHTRLPAKVREQLQAELVSWKDSDDGRKILQALGFGDLVPVNPDDYQHMPKLD